MEKVSISTRHLDLSGSYITEICPEIGMLTNLQTLNLRNNAIIEICPEIGL